MTGLAPPPFDPAAAAAAAARFADVAAAEADVAYAWTDSPVGRLLLATTARGLVRVCFEADDEDAVLDDLARRLSPRVLAAPARLDTVRRELDQYFAGKRTAFDLMLDWTLVSAFGRRILGATAQVPFGRTATYGEMAAAAGNPKAARAAGRALNANPIPIIIPCHRIVGASGALVGYGGGIDRKVALLTLEGVLTAP